MTTKPFTRPNPIKKEWTNITQADYDEYVDREYEAPCQNLATDIDDFRTLMNFKMQDPIQSNLAREEIYAMKDVIRNQDLERLGVLEKTSIPADPNAKSEDEFAKAKKLLTGVGKEDYRAYVIHVLTKELGGPPTGQELEARKNLWVEKSHADPVFWNGIREAVFQFMKERRDKEILELLGPDGNASAFI
jgi:hypothetical protein